MRSLRAGVLFNEVTRNGWLWAALVLCIMLLAAPPYLPSAAHLLYLAPLTAAMWRVVLACSLAPLVVTQAVMAINSRRRARSLLPSQTTGKGAR
jgi:Ca2+-transporting ATPase